MHSWEHHFGFVCIRLSEILANSIPPERERDGFISVPREVVFRYWCGLLGPPGSMWDAYAFRISLAGVVSANTKLYILPVRLCNAKLVFWFADVTLPSHCSYSRYGSSGRELKLWGKRLRHFLSHFFGARFCPMSKGKLKLQTALVYCTYVFMFKLQKNENVYYLKSPLHL